MKKIKYLYLYLVGELKRWLNRKLIKENESRSRKAARELHLRQEAVKKQRQESCHHLAGGNELSEQEDFIGRTSIVWHLTDISVWVGFCLNCQRQFNPSDSDFRFWFEKTSFCSSSSAGHRDRFGEAELKPRDPPATFPSAYQAEGLDFLSDQEIKDLLDGVRESRRIDRRKRDEPIPTT